jgi:hypothetical protein
MVDATAHVDVVYLPYLPLRGRSVVGDWELIARAELRTDDCLDERAEELAQGLGAVYLLPKNHRTPAGAFARPLDGLVGDPARDMRSFDDLRRACVAAVLDPNQDPRLPDEHRDWNAGHWMLTTENATLVGHGITPNGSRFPFLSIGVSVLDQPTQLNGQRGEILPPSDVRLPTFGARPFDHEYANAIWESIRRGDDASRRLSRAIDWLGLATLNTTSLTNDVRVPSWRAGLEALLGTDNYLTLGERLSPLIGDESPPLERKWQSLDGSRTRTKELGEVAWWCVRFSFLRNKLMHGAPVIREDWAHDDLLHVDLADWYLRQAIKHTVANDGHAEILQELIWRKAFAELLERHEAASEDDA